MTWLHDTWLNVWLLNVETSARASGGFRRNRSGTGSRPWPPRRRVAWTVIRNLYERRGRCRLHSSARSNLETPRPPSPPLPSPRQICCCEPIDARRRFRQHQL